MLEKKGWRSFTPRSIRNCMLNVIHELRACASCKQKRHVGRPIVAFFFFGEMRREHVTCRETVFSTNCGKKTREDVRTRLILRPSYPHVLVSPPFISVFKVAGEGASAKSLIGVSWTAVLLLIYCIISYLLCTLSWTKGFAKNRLFFYFHLLYWFKRNRTIRYISFW